MDFVHTQVPRCWSTFRFFLVFHLSFLAFTVLLFYLNRNKLPIKIKNIFTGTCKKILVLNHDKVLRICLIFFILSWLLENFKAFSRCHFALIRSPSVCISRVPRLKWALEKLGRILIAWLSSFNASSNSLYWIKIIARLLCDSDFTFDSLPTWPYSRRACSCFPIAL